MSDVFRNLYNELIETGGAIHIRFVTYPSCGVYYMWLALADNDNGTVKLLSKIDVEPLTIRAKNSPF